MVNVKDFKESYTGLRLRELKHRRTYIKSDNRMAEALQRYDSCSSKKSDNKIRYEIALCKRFWSCYPLHYYRYNHYTLGMQLSDDQLRDYIPEFFFYSIFLPYYDSGRYKILLEDKNITDNIFRSLEIPTPNTLSKIIDGRIYSPTFRETSIKVVTEKAANMGFSKLFLKPANGQGGYGILVFHINESGEYQDKKGIRLNDTFLQQTAVFRRNHYILQAGLLQHKNLLELYPHSVNTFRIVTENKEGNTRVVCSVIRIGCDGREVDNVSQGGLILKIDSETGKAGEYGINESGTKYDRHPNSAFSFDRFQISDWEVIKSFVLENAKKLPQFTYLGWDIAFTEEGPVAIEANLGFGLDLFQIALGGLREAFGILDPDFYWRNIGKRIERI